MKDIINRICKNDLIVNIMRVYSVKMIVLIFGLLSSIVVARILGPEKKGVLGVATAIVGIGVQFGNFGIHSANTYYLSKDKNILPQVIGNSLLVTLFIAIISFFVFLVGILFPDKLPVDSSLIFGLIMITIPFQLYNMLQQNFFIAIKEINKYNVIELLNGVLYPVIILLCSMSIAITPNIAMLISFLTSCALIIVGFILVYKNIKSNISIRIDLLMKCIPFGFKSYISCLLSYLVLRVDVLLIKHFLGDYQTGIYTLSVNLADIVNMIAVSTSMLLYPKMASMKNSLERTNFIIKVLKVITAVMMILVLLAFLFAEFFIDLLYGIQYHESIAVFKILLIGIVFWALCSVLFNYFASENKLIINIISPAVGLIINVILNCYLIPTHGIKGAAIASSIAYAIIFLMLYVKLQISKRNVISVEGNKSEEI